MKVYEFTVILKGIDYLDDDIPERLYEAGCDDSTPFSRDGICGAEFDREADSLEAAIRSAVADVRSAGYDVQQVTIDEGDLAELMAA